MLVRCVTMRAGALNVLSCAGERICCCVGMLQGGAMRMETARNKMGWLAFACVHMELVQSTLMPTFAR